MVSCPMTTVTVSAVPGRPDVVAAKPVNVDERALTSLAAGTVFHGRYQILRCLKAGGMGAIYECVHVTTRKHRALKVMLPQIIASAGMRERFELEARVTAEIESEHIVETFDAGVDDVTGMPFLVMELLRGDDLDGILTRTGPFCAAETVTVLLQVAHALDRTHAAGIVHRDLKPQNLFLTARDDGSPRVKLLDFGIAKVVADGTKLLQKTEAIGTPIYMAPEQASGDGTIGPAADLYALGHIAYTLLTGHAYWSEEYHKLPMLRFLNKVVAGGGEPVLVRAARYGVMLPLAFGAWFARATAVSPADRFDCASTQIAALAQALGLGAPLISPETSSLSVGGMKGVFITERLPPQAPPKAAPTIFAEPIASELQAESTNEPLIMPLLKRPAKRSTRTIMVGAVLVTGAVVGTGMTMVRPDKEVRATETNAAQAANSVAMMTTLVRHVALASVSRSVAVAHAATARMQSSTNKSPKKDDLLPEQH